MHTNLTADLNWFIPNQQTLRYEQRHNLDANATVEPMRQTAFE